MLLATHLDKGTFSDSLDLKIKSKFLNV